MTAARNGYGPIGSNTGFIFASQGVGSVLRAVYAAVLARQLGPELFGLMNYGLGWYAAFLAVANLQLESYMSRQIALEPGRAPEILSRALTLRMLSTIGVFAIAVIAALTSEFSPGEDNLLAAILLIYSLAMAGRSAAMWCNSAFISRENARHVLTNEVGFRMAEMLAGIAALSMGYGLVAIAVIHALSWWGQSIWGFLLVRRRLAAVHVRFRPREQAALFMDVLPVAVSSIAATWLMQGPFLLFRDKAAAPDELGLVALVLQIFVLVTAAPVALGRAALPALSRTVVRTDRKEVMFLGVVLRTAIPATAMFVIGAAATRDWLVPLVFGEAYRAAGAYLAYAMMLVLPFGVASIASQILIAHGRTWQAMAASLAGAVAMTIFVQLFVHSSGEISRYLLCVLAGMIVWLVLTLALCGRLVTVDWFRFVAKPMFAGGLAVGLYCILGARIGAWPALSLALVFLVFSQWLFGIVDRQERAALWRHARAALVRGADPD